MVIDRATEDGDRPSKIYRDDGADDENKYAFLMMAFQHFEEMEAWEEDPIIRTHRCKKGCEEVNRRIIQHCLSPNAT